VISCFYSKCSHKLLYSTFLADFIKFIEIEKCRLETFVSFKRSVYTRYLFENLVKNINCYVNIFLHEFLEDSKQDEAMAHQEFVVISEFAKILNDRIDTTFKPEDYTQYGMKQIKTLLNYFGIENETVVCRFNRNRDLMLFYSEIGISLKISRSSMEEKFK
jgi:hypothetical protein